MKSVAVAVLLASSSVFAFGPGHDGPGPEGGCMHGGMGRGPGWRAQSLNLSAEQQKQVAALESKRDADMAPVRAQMDQKRSELQARWSAPSPDRGAIVAKQAEMEPLREKMRSAQIDFRLAFQKLLTPAQREQWSSGPQCARGGGSGAGGGGFGGSDMPCGGDCPRR